MQFYFSKEEALIPQSHFGWGVRMGEYWTEDYDIATMHYLVGNMLYERFCYFIILQEQVLAQWTKISIKLDSVIDKTNKSCCCSSPSRFQ